jgi:hypothetical protein
VVLGLLLAAATTGCRQDEVTFARVPKAAEAPVAAAVAPVAPQQQPLVEAPQALEGPALHWTLPKGWTETHPGGMRVATLTPPGGRVDVSVIALPGPAGGELANVNRWRGQIGLPPLDEAALAAARKAVRSKAGPIAVYDFTSEGAAKTRLIAALTTASGSTWFVKMVGGAAEVRAASGDFNHLIESLRADGN